jgi:hypothetical protein
MKTALAALLVCSAVLTAPLARADSDPARRERRAWVERCIKDFQSIKPGMTRSQVEKLLRHDGGLMQATQWRYRHPDCDYFKIDVDYSVKRDSSGQLLDSANDKVVAVSKPYLEWPVDD